MDSDTRRFVRERASFRCEYCLIIEAMLERTFHVEHVIAKQHGGGDEVENLALACDRCNLYKGPNLSTIDPGSRSIVPLFHPRRDTWTEHFGRRDAHIIGLTAIGRATVQLLLMNSRDRLIIREQFG